ncbi:beta-L-arabinofuranosidase domain-containing protein [Pedobacter sp.]|uniref:beta-L-arabinofuranosidase domain-containing protein n=1 Tax=Pedobacter sp. TaxID=1411316 RepID=UPI003D7FE093
MKVFYTMLLLIGASTAIHAQKVKPSIRDKFFASNYSVVKGHIGEKLDQSYENRILVQDIEHLVAPFRSRKESRMWQSEFWGKYVTSAVLAYKYRPEPAMMNTLKEAVAGLIATQTQDGYIGNYSPEHRLEQWDIWGRKYSMLGLLDYHELTSDQASLAAAVKVADHLMKELADRDGVIVNKGNYRGMAASSVLEPMVKLYRLTVKEKYLNFAKEIVRQWETPEGPNLISKADQDVSSRFARPASWYSLEQGQKAYEMMSCYEGLLELYRITGDPMYKAAVEKTWQNIRATEINVAGSGASEEMWFSGHKRQTLPVAHFQETCVTATWIKLNQQLLRLTGEVKYADEIEKSYYNALLGALNHDASEWAKYTPLNGRRLPGSGQCGMNLNCCDASGPRGQFTLPLTTVMGTGDGLAVNFYVEGQYSLTTPKGKKVVLNQQTDYPVSGLIKLSLNLPKAEEMTLQLRIPAWSEINEVYVNDELIRDVKAGTSLKIKRSWNSKDMVRVKLDMRGRVERHDANGSFASIFRGPMVLSRDTRFGGPDLITANRPVVDKAGYFDLRPVSNTNGENLWMHYKGSFVPESYKEVAAEPIEIDLIDYASAGNGTQNSTFAVWLPQVFSNRER